jgi:Flp pilus assembly protein TadG
MFLSLRRGQALIILVMLLTVIAAGGALALDVGTAYAFRERCEFVMEAAALAAAAKLPDVGAARAAAAAIAQANGLDPAKTIVTTPYQGDSGQVQVAYGDDKATLFGRVFGVDLLRVNTRAAASVGRPAVFDYALFSGSTTTRLDLSGMTLNVGGSVHANHDVRIRGASVRVTGAIAAARTVDARGSSVVAGSIVNQAAIVPMPVYDTSTLRDMCSTRYSGAQHWSGTTLHVNGNIFVDGSLKLSGVSITGRGMIIATGNIELAGTSLRYTNPGTDSLALYSAQDIRVTGTGFVADGILYARGELSCHGSSLTVNGQIIADEIDFSGVSVSINYAGSASGLFPGSAARLTR